MHGTKEAARFVTVVPWAPFLLLQRHAHAKDDADGNLIQGGPPDLDRRQRESLPLPMPPPSAVGTRSGTR